MNTADQIIQKLSLVPHPEGGYFRETYRSQGSINQDSLNENYTGIRNFSTGIYFLLTPDSFSAFHKITQDEMWHFYDGSAIVIHVISPYGEYTKHVVGKDIMAGQVPQFVVPGGHWFAASVINNGDYSLCGCTVSPGFDFVDFILAEPSQLMAQFPMHDAIIGQLTR